MDIKTDADVIKVIKEYQKTQRYYRLVFFQGTRQDEKIFILECGLTDAILEGRRHCELMGYRFGMVRPAIVDLKHQEKLKFSDPEWSEKNDEPQDIDKRKKEAEEKEKKLEQKRLKEDSIVQ